MEINEAINLLKNIMKNSTALDEFRHINLTLAPASERPKYQKALKIVADSIQAGKISKEDVQKILEVK
jgi:hypothetical protein